MNRIKKLFGVTIAILCACLGLQSYERAVAVKRLNEMLAAQPTSDYEEGFSDGAEYVIRMSGYDTVAGCEDKIRKLKNIIRETSPQILRISIQMARPAGSINHESQQKE